MDPSVAEWLRQGILGLIIIGFLTGWIVPKPTVDAMAKRESLKDALIEQQADTIERLTKRLSAQAKPRSS